VVTSPDTSPPSLLHCFEKTLLERFSLAWNTSVAVPSEPRRRAVPVLCENKIDLKSGHLARTSSRHNKGLERPHRRFRSPRTWPVPCPCR
jgi:hypothetical protein